MSLIIAAESEPEVGQSRGANEEGEGRRRRRHCGEISEGPKDRSIVTSTVSLSLYPPEFEEAGI